MIHARVWNNWRRTIRFRLAWLVIACVLPVWLAAGSIVYFAYQEKRETIEGRLLETARALSQVVDRELAIIESALDALATSPSLSSGDFTAFHSQARELLKTYEGADIIVAEATGQQLVNTYRPVGSPLPKRAVNDAVRRVFEEGRASVTGLFKGALTGRFLIGVDMPVFREGRVVYDLAMTLPADRFVKILSAQQLPPQWVGLILDSNRVVVGRTLLPERYVGKQIPPLLLKEPGVWERTAEFLNLDNVPSLAGISKSRMSKWAVVINVPKAVVLSEIWRWLLWAVVGTTLLSVAGVVLAVFIGRSISRSIGSLIPQASDLASGKPVFPGSLGFEETEAVGQALAHASLLLKERTENLERSNRELEEFAAVASHDLQEPLRKIQAFGERLRVNQAHVLDEEGLDFLGRMEKAADRMQVLILNLLEYSRVTTRPSPFAATDLGQLAEEARSDLEEVIAKTGAEIEIEKLPRAEVDASQMRRVFQNLLSNALKYHGEAPPRVRVSGDVIVEAGQDLARILVEDNGIGFEEKYLERIFQPFQRLHGRNKFTGTGIGLAIVKKSIVRHRGRITAKSMPSRGSTFIFHIPLKQPQA